MRRDHDEDYGARHDGNEIVEFGARSDRGRQWLSRLLLACFVIAVVVGLIFKATNHKSQPQPRSHPLPAQQVASSKPPTVVNVGHPLLGVTAGWELFARGPNDLVAIQMARGRITKTYVPALESGLPEVSFIVGSHEAIVRSPDKVPGYVIPDGRVPRLVSGLLANAGPLIPGPHPDQVWAMTGTSSQPTASLMTLAGRLAGETISFNPFLQLSGTTTTDGRISATTTTDGRGYLLVLANPVNIEYNMGPMFVTRISDQVIAVGPTRWLALACRHRHCTDNVIDPADGSRRALPGPAIRNSAWSWPPVGVVSPNGSAAAVLTSSKANKITIELVDLRSGFITALNVSMDSSPPNDCIAWSPDSKWLFIAAAGGRLLAFNAHTRQVHGLGVQLPDITQVAIRPAAG